VTSAMLPDITGSWKSKMAAVETGGTCISASARCSDAKSVSFSTFSSTINSMVLLLIYSFW
jgi:hypothetical protein